MAETNLELKIRERWGRGAVYTADPASREEAVREASATIGRLLRLLDEQTDTPHDELFDGCIELLEGVSDTDPARFMQLSEGAS